MKKKINTQFIIVSFIAIILTMSLSVGTFYELFVQEMRNDMKAYTHVLRSAGVFNASNEEKLNLKNEDLRITIIDADGTVVYDNEANDIEMDNHKDRPEIEAALKNGEGSDVRKSSTLNKSTYYYAVLLDDGQVLRIAKEASSVWNIFIKVLPLILGIIILMLFSVGIITHYITKSIVKPVEELANNIDEIKDIKTYKEIQPFIDTIKKQHEDIVKNSHVRQEFTANVSHELKTPLTSISGYSELIENGMATQEDTIRFAGEIHKSSQRLLTLINDIIELSELDSSESKVAMETVNIYDIAKNCVEMLKFNAKDHGVNLKFEGTPCNITANKMMMEELVYNLLSNAIRYNREGGSATVRVNKILDRVNLEVLDTGIGISKENQKRIFERFYRVDKSRSKSTGGTGLGLAIVKHILIKHNAQLELESTEGKGTHITVIFQPSQKKA
ncbi:ATP-binding protein [Eubacterium sp.]|uniref:sensor histidine kinase n=1 Tax=Eubacterium sp. TaxID=142586 RepID=UPI0035200AC9